MYRYFTDLDFRWAIQGGLKMLSIRVDSIDKIGFTNRFPVCRIANTKDESTLVGCIGQPS